MTFQVFDGGYKQRVLGVDDISVTGVFGLRIALAMVRILQYGSLGFTGCFRIRPPDLISTRCASSPPPKVLGQHGSLRVHVPKKYIRTYIHLQTGSRVQRETLLGTKKCGTGLET